MGLHHAFRLLVFGLLPLPGFAQDSSINPGINDSFQDPDVPKFLERFEAEGREVYDHRAKIIETLDLKPGMAVADIGCGTGLFTRLLAPAVGSEGKVYAVDIAKKFVDHTLLSVGPTGMKNVEGVVCSATDANLPEASIDLAFICDTYHHFEFPFKTMASLKKALRPGGRVVMIDFERVPGESSEWILNHVRAGKETVLEEMEQSGFLVAKDHSDLLEDNWFARFVVPEIRDVSIAEATSLLANGEAKVIDVRTSVEYQAGHLEDALLIDYRSRNFAEELKALDKSQSYVVHCAVGGRSGASLKTFERLGFHRIYHLAAGYNGWIAAGEKTVK